MMIQRSVILLLVLMVVFVGSGGDESGKSKDAGSVDQTEKKVPLQEQKKITWEKDGAEMVLIPEVTHKEKDTYDEFGDLIPGNVFKVAVEYSESNGITLADLIRQGLDHICNQKSSESNQPDTTWLQEQIEIKDGQVEELLKQHNQNQQIIMSMNQNQKLLVESKRTWIQRLFGLNVESA